MKFKLSPESSTRWVCAVSLTDVVARVTGVAEGEAGDYDTSRNESRPLLHCKFLPPAM